MADKGITSSAASRQSSSYRVASIINFSVLAVVMFVLLLLSLISLGTFGEKQAEVVALGDGTGCVLYGRSETVLNVLIIRFSSYGTCGFLFWGWSSVAIVAIFFIVYLIVHAILGSNMFSRWRIVDIAVSIPTFIFSFIFSIVVTDGLNKTCNAFRVNDVSRQASCSDFFFIRLPDNGDRVPFYDQISVAVDTSWIATFVLLGYAAWNIGLLIFFFCQRRRQDKAQKQDKSGAV